MNLACAIVKLRTCVHERTTVTRACQIIKRCAQHQLMKLARATCGDDELRTRDHNGHTCMSGQKMRSVSLGVLNEQLADVRAWRISSKWSRAFPMIGRCTHHHLMKLARATRGHKNLRARAHNRAFLMIGRCAQHELMKLGHATCGDKNLCA